MNDQQDIHQHIDAILASIETAHRGQRLPTTEDQEAPYQHRPHTVIDVYVVEREQDDDNPPLTVESTLDAPLTQKCQENDDEEPESTTTLHEHQQSTPPRWLLVALVALSIVLLGAGSSMYLVSLFTPSASVTLVTQAQQLTTTSTLHLVTNGTADPTKNQLAGRMLPTITMSQQKTLPTTGTARQAAQAAHGLITFYNAAPYVQTVEVGTLLTGADGRAVITDQDATIPAAIMPTEGQVTILAHAALTGPQGNIKAGDIYGQCCRLNVFVANGAFHGGLDARTYQTVTQQDITSVVSSLKTSVDQSVQAAFQIQVQPTETLLTPLACTSKVTADHRAGEEATQVQVMLDETCIGTAYTTQALTTLATQRATQDANTRLGTGYTTTGVQTRITQVRSTTHDSSELAITSVSMWMYPFAQGQQHSIKAMIAGMSKDKATTTLLHMAGIQSVSITLKNGTTLPRDEQHISILFLQV